MLGVNILLHSIKLVFRNLQTALRISSPFVVLLILISVMTPFGVATFDRADQMMTTLWLLLPLMLIASVWVAVAWHRYVLMEEDTGQFLPAFHGTRIGAYVMQSILLFIVLFLIMLVLGLLVGLIVAVIQSTIVFVALPILLMAVAFWFFYRVSPVLPGAALGAPVDFGDAWRATKPLSGAIFIMMIMLAVVSALANYVIAQLGGSSVILLIVASAIQSWITLMVGVSILTTIYGIAVEGRDL